MTPEELRRLIGNRPYGSDGRQIPREVLQFLKEISERNPKNWGRYAYQIVQDMTDDELMARWARYKLEKEE